VTGLRRRRRRLRIRERDLPHETLVRDAVVVGCDGTPSCDAAVRFAAAEARLRCAELVVVIAYVRPVDPDLPSFDTPDGKPRSRARLAAEQALWCEALGGPAGYAERLGGYPAMLAHHRDLGITAEQRFRFASLMSLAADDAGLPDDPEFRAALIGYLEWGTRLAMHNSQPGADVAQQAPVPHWGWGAAPPYQP
jgi:truncated hemoglobin YjbI